MNLLKKAPAAVLGCGAPGGPDHRRGAAGLQARRPRFAARFGAGSQGEAGVGG